jgi:hypothetical protein
LDDISDPYQTDQGEILGLLVKQATRPMGKNGNNQINRATDLGSGRMQQKNATTKAPA